MMASLKVHLKITFMIGLCVALGSVVSKAQNANGTFMLQGQKVYEQYCLTCHQSEGGGVLGMNPPLKHSSYVTGDNHQLIGILMNGLKDNIVVNGKSYSNVMPSQSNLKDEEVVAVITYIRKKFNNSDQKVNVKEVADYRLSLKR